MKWIACGFPGQSALLPSAAKPASEGQKGRKLNALFEQKSHPCHYSYMVPKPML
jgi:hypothetical protein